MFYEVMLGGKNVIKIIYIFNRLGGFYRGFMENFKGKLYLDFNVNRIELYNINYLNKFYEKF